MSHQAPTPDHSGPRIVELTDQPYAAIRAQVTRSRIPEVVDRMREIVDHLTERGIKPAGAPFLKYDVLGPGQALEMEAGVPVSDVSEGADAVAFSILRGGRFATVTHHGHYDRLKDTTQRLLEWGEHNRVRWDMDERDGAQAWGARLEIYTTNPLETPDPKDWVTDLLFRLA
ncbi:MAG: GyrI-like domain-containing protein [Actinomycetales bacterium]